jgi:hypothetical protein
LCCTAPTWPKTRHPCALGYGAPGRVFRCFQNHPRYAQGSAGSSAGKDCFGNYIGAYLRLFAEEGRGSAAHRLQPRCRSG